MRNVKPLTYDSAEFWDNAQRFKMCIRYEKAKSVVAVWLGERRHALFLVLMSAIAQCRDGAEFLKCADQLTWVYYGAVGSEW